jgi:hypothetical protein
VYLRKIQRRYKDKTYLSYLLVESVYTAKGPRQRIVCSLGDLKPKPAAEWLSVLERAVAELRKQAFTTRRGDPPSHGVR